MITTCIRCGQPGEHSLCPSCADILLASYAEEDVRAFARLGIDVSRDQKLGIIRPKGHLADKFRQYKEEENGKNNDETTKS